MPYSACKKLNYTPTKCSTYIIHLDKSKIKVISELKLILIKIASNSEFHLVIDIVVVDILEAYGLFLSNDWSQKLQGYFASN